MASSHCRERGEGRIGCFITLLVLLSAVAAGFKIVPVFYTNSTLMDAAADAAGEAALYTVPALEAKLRARAAELGIPEAGAEGAMTITTAGQKLAGICTISFNYKRTVDLYGIYSLDIPTKKTITKPYLDAR